MPEHQTNTTIDDETLYHAVMAGDRSALGTLVQRYHAPLYRFLVRQTGDEALADDLAQETFTRLLKYHGTPPTYFKAWAYTIARNLARDHFKSARSRYEQTVDFDDHNYHALPDEDFVLPDDDRQVVINVLGRLSPDHREVLILRFYNDLKVEEIAEVTGAPVGTVKSRLFHALKHMKAFLALQEVGEYARHIG